MLIIFGGLPGSGKTTVAQALARQIEALYLRVDTIEQAIRASAPLAGGQDVGPSGYVTLYRLATDNLRFGRTVIADSVNPLEITRNAFRKAATDADSKFIEVEIVCTDTATHRYRVETRQPTIEGLTPPTWVAIEALRYEEWDSDLRLDTSYLAVEESVAKIINLLRR